MNITLQYPIVDCRLFVKEPYKLRKPYFISPDTEKNEYIRYFGSMKDRRFQSYYYCVGENTFCSAKNALRIMYDLFCYRNKVAKLRHYENRFYSDGNISCRFEINSHYSISLEEISNEDSFVNQFLDLHYQHGILINDGNGGFIKQNFFGAGDFLANLYLKGSTTYKSLSYVKKYWVQTGQPIIHIELLNHGLTNIEVLPVDAKTVYTSYTQVKVYHYIYNSIACWILLKEDNSPETLEACRNLKTALLRIHAEKQNLIKALNFLSLNKDNDEIDKNVTVKFIKRTLEKLLKNRRFNLDQSPFVDLAFKIDDNFSQTDYLKMYHVIQDINNKYLSEDFNCLYAQIDFDNLFHLYQNQVESEGVLSELRNLPEMTRKKDKLGLKLLLKNNKTLIEGCKSTALYDLLKWITITLFAL